MPNTPYYLFDIDCLRARAALIQKKADAAGVGLCYAIKANAFLTPHLLDHVEGLEVCSHGELKLCKKQGMPMDAIILSGVNKEPAFVEDGVLSGVGMITAESSTHFDLIKRYSELHKRKVRVLLRLSCGAQFGMDREVLSEIIRRREENPYIDIVGIHYFTGTQKKKAGKIIKEIELALSLIAELEERYDYSAELLEYGPGFGVPYFEGDEFEGAESEWGLSLCDEVFDWISHNRAGQADEPAAIPGHPVPVNPVSGNGVSVNPAPGNPVPANPIPADPVSGNLIPDGLKINFEMGRFFVASCGTYHTAIADLKTNDGLNVCIIDGGKNHLSYYGQNMALKTPLIEHSRSAEAADDADSTLRRNIEPGSFNGSEAGAAPEAGCAAAADHSSGSSAKGYTIFGSLCSFNDIIARDVPLEEPGIGDVLTFKNAGAYSVTEGIYLFLSRPMPEIWLREGGELTKVREAAETFEYNG